MRFISSSGSLSLVAVAVVATLFVGCSSSDDEAADSTSTTASTSTTTSTTTTSTTTTTAPTATTTTSPPPTTTVPPPPPDDGSVALAFFRRTESACAEHAGRTSNPVVPAENFRDATAVESRGGGVWIIRDGGGDLLLVDPGRGVVHSPDGEAAPLPIAYSFGCSETLYLGSMHD